MGKISKELWGLFKAYLIRKEKESHVSSSFYPSSYRCGGIGTFNDYREYDGVIYFYEWSDINRAPMVFYNMTAFINFLVKSDIYIPPYQKDMLLNLEKAYVTCKKGKSELIIRATRPGLLEAVSREDAPGVSLYDLPEKKPAGQLMLPYHVQCTYPPSQTNVRKPPMYCGNPNGWFD